MSPGVLRSRTARTLTIVRDRHGDAHPATWAAYGRLVAAWGRERVRALSPEPGPLELLLIAFVAATRASSRPGHNNRSSRRHLAAF